MATIEHFRGYLFDGCKDMARRLADAMDTRPYQDRFFRTLMSLYDIDSDGKIFGNGARVALIGGIELAKFLGEYHRRGWDSRPPEDIQKEEMADLIIRHGRVAREGDVLAVVINPRDIRRGKSPYIVTSSILKITETSELPVC